MGPEAYIIAGKGVGRAFFLRKRRPIYEINNRYKSIQLFRMRNHKALQFFLKAEKYFHI